MFPVLDAAAIELLRQFSKETRYPRGGVILRRGEMGEAFYVILAGEVEISVEDPEGDRLQLSELGVGNFFGSRNGKPTAGCKSTKATTNRESVDRISAVSQDHTHRFIRLSLRNSHSRSPPPLPPPPQRSP